MDLGGRTFVEGLPAEPTAERDAMILHAVRAKFIRPIQWVPVDMSAGTHKCTVFVSDDAVAVGSGIDFVRINVRHPTAQLIADELGGLLVTTRISDRSFLQADVKLRPHPLPSDARMAFTERMIAHHDAIEAERGNRTGLVRPVGKEYINTNLLEGKPDRCAIFGWHSPTGGDRSPGGQPVIQLATATAHWAPFVDYSQTVTLAAQICIVDGLSRSLEEVMRSAELAHLVSDEGPLRVTRHPAVPKLPPVVGYWPLPADHQLHPSACPRPTASPHLAA